MCWLLCFITFILCNAQLLKWRKLQSSLGVSVRDEILIYLGVAPISPSVQLFSYPSDGGGVFILYVCDRFMSVSPHVPSHVPDMLGCWGPPFCGPLCVLFCCWPAGRSGRSIRYRYVSILSYSVFIWVSSSRGIPSISSSQFKGHKSLANFLSLFCIIYLL